MKNTEKKEIHVITRAVIIKDDQLLVCVGKNKQYVFLPGGHVEVGESSEHALKREMYEELGLKSDVKRFLGCFEYAYEYVISFVTPCHVHEINLIFEVDVPELQAGVIPQSPEDHTIFAWISLSADEKDIRFLPTSLLPLILTWRQEDCSRALVSKINSI